MQSNIRKTETKTIYYSLVVIIILTGYLVSPIRIRLPGIGINTITDMAESVIVFLFGLIIALLILLVFSVIENLDRVPGHAKLVLKWFIRFSSAFTLVLSMYLAIWVFSLSTVSPIIPISEAVMDSEGYSYTIYKITGGAMSSSKYELRKERSLVPGIKYSKVLCGPGNYPGVYKQNGNVNVSCD